MESIVSLLHAGSEESNQKVLGMLYELSSGVSHGRLSTDIKTCSYKHGLMSFSISAMEEKEQQERTTFFRSLSSGEGQRENSSISTVFRRGVPESRRLDAKKKRNGHMTEKQKLGIIHMR